jgi:predicted secreted protein
LSIDLPIDTEQEIVGPTTNDRERRAQLFASYFLMPLPLVARTARRYGVVRRGTASAQQAYSIARDMHVSFEAAVRQLQNYNFISRNNAVDVLKTQPLRIKRELADGRPPTEARGDVWRMAVENNKACLEVFEGDDVVVALPENRTTGFRWLYSAPEIPDARPEPPPFDRAPLELDGPEVETPEPQEELVLPSDAPVGVVFDRFMMEDLPSGIATEGDESRTGGAGTRWIVLHAAEAGQWHEHLLYASPFRPDDAPVEDLSMYIAVRDKPAAESRRRWLSEFSKAELEG